MQKYKEKSIYKKKLCARRPSAILSSKQGCKQAAFSSIPQSTLLTLKKTKNLKLLFHSVKK